MNIAGLPVTSSALAAPSAGKRLFGLIWGETKVGKTIVASGLDAITQETLKKRTLIVACEQSKDAGLDRVAHLDIPTVVLRDDARQSAFDKCLAVTRDPAVAQQFGGVLLDGLTELGLHSVQQHILAKIDQGAQSKQMRDFGAMVERDYVVFQEAIRKILVALARMNDAGLHVLVTCGSRTYTHRERGSSEAVIDKVGPAFPGRGPIDMVETIIPTIAEVTQRTVKHATGMPTVESFLEFTRKGKRLRGDRTGLFPDEAPGIVLDAQGRPVSNLPNIFREHWQAAIAPPPSAAPSQAA